MLQPAAPRLACVKPAASVHPEPGSNSPLYNLFKFQSDPALLLLHSKKFTLALSIVMLQLPCTISKIALSLPSFQSTLSPVLSKRAANIALLFLSPKKY